ncbi:MAG: polysaccharide pyruvyl transferase family protein [Victivallales bacterium]|nr:polysaccharide pyruvyl transferase family protein [Victivallales bacterium]
MSTSSAEIPKTGLKKMRILLGGIPLGLDNIGDEAILACVVRMIRESIPDARITVATADAGTADLLGVDTVPPYGFADRPFTARSNLVEFSQLVQGQDAYVWCGATGLSDYPDVALDLLETAQESGVPTFVWGVGMDDELNPVFFKAHGKKRMVLNCLGLTGWYERHLRNRLRKRIAGVLPKCRGVWARDPQSAAMLASMGFPSADVAADTAILLEPTAKRAVGKATGRLGLCISTQRQVSDLEGVKGMLEEVRGSGAQVVGIPMNPKTDRALLEGLGVECIAGTTPAAVIDAASECDAVLSSRLHLLILAANAGTPILGIARGSKLQNWLANFGRTVEGSVYDCDWKTVTRHVLEQLANRGDWDDVRKSAYEKLLARFNKARSEFIERLVRVGAAHA